MSDKTIVTIDSAQLTRQFKELDEHKVDMFVDVLHRVEKDSPKPADLQELRQWFANYPELWRVIFDLAELLKIRIIQGIVSGEAGRMALDTNISVMKRDLGYDDAPVLEKLLIDSVVIAWLRNEWAEYQIASFMRKGEVRMSVAEFWERRLTASQRRYLSACEALARVRRLSARHPSLQVNIATQSGQQVNVAGDLTKSA